jgi:hypothetical protein
LVFTFTFSAYLRIPALRSHYFFDGWLLSYFWFIGFDGYTYIHSMNLRVPRMQLDDDADLQSIARSLETFPSIELAFVPWPAYAYKPEARFCIAHNGSSIFLQYHIRESAVRAAVWQTNGPVWEDSCVEFFIAFDETGYYNLECNAAGTMHIAFGKHRAKRRCLDADVIRSVRRQAFIYSGGGETWWKLTTVIPARMLVHHDIVNFSGKNATANFYKCGDRLPQPHYLAWNPVEAPEPDFHLPQYFGTLQFES